MKHVLLSTLLLFFISIVKGQSIEGFIQDKSGEGLIGANIINLSDGLHTHSGLQGFFEIQATNGDSLSFTYLGYKTLIHVVASQEVLHINLEESALKMEEVTISPSLDAIQLFADINTQINPVSSSQEVLRQVPGLFIGQHAGGGKAEQLFLRGFDIDHGTDISIEVDGMPVNMVSHAHGQGYADLHFVIPELIESIDFGKGTYHADRGNFTTAGWVEFNTKDALDHNLIKTEIGDFNTQRALGMFSLVDQKGHHAYIASEFLFSDGPFVSSQDFSRINLFGKYKGMMSAQNQLEVQLSHFDSQWNASGQIPQRAVDSGRIGRFGAIDDTEGGFTSRTNVSVDFTSFLSNHSAITNKVYYNRYDFELYSNFTFFLNDPINGDQIRQKENRDLFGISSTYQSSHKVNTIKYDWQVGVGLRYDKSYDNELSRTANRSETLSRISFGDINESNYYSFTDLSIHLGKFTVNGGLRLDQFRFAYTNKLNSVFDSKSVSQAIVSPKISLLYNQSSYIQYYAKAGKGFHSNDSRVVVAKSGEEVLPAAYSTEVGFIYKPWSQLIINSTLWNLYLEQEFVYVGDEGVVEPSGKTSRQGVELNVRYQPLSWLYINADANYTAARSIDSPSSENRIPLAPDLTTQINLNVIHPSGLYGGFELRSIGDRPANEDNSIVAEGYTVLDFNLGYEWNRLDFGVQILNVLDTEWNETQFATESRLFSEINSVEEIHFTPGTPRFIKGRVSFKF